MKYETKYVVIYNNNWVHIYDDIENAIEEIEEIIDEEDIVFDGDYPYGCDTYGNQAYIVEADYKKKVE